jgi:hypothetical protein
MGGLCSCEFNASRQRHFLWPNKLVRTFPKFKKTYCLLGIQYSTFSQKKYRTTPFYHYGKKDGIKSHNDRGEQ